MNRFRTSEQEKTYWSIHHLQRKGISLGERPGLEELETWKGEAASTPGGIQELIRMEGAWRTHQARKKSKAAGKKPSSYVLSAQAKNRLASLAKQSGATITSTLESLILDEHQLMQQERAATKAAKEALSEKTKDLEATRKLLKNCVARLSDCTVVMKDAGLSMDALTEEQRQQSADLQREMLRKLGGNDITLILNALLSSRMDRGSS